MHVGWWLIAAVVLGIIEVLSVDLVFAMFAVGALAAALAAAFGASTAVEAGAFAIVSVALLLLVRPLIKKHLEDSTPRIETNVQALIGRGGRVTSTVTGTDGRVRLGGEVWSARSADGSVLTEGAPVLVTDIDGATAVVVADSDSSTRTATTER